MVVWFGESFQVDRLAVRQKVDQEFSHDHLFHTMLGLMEIEAEEYDEEMDLFAGCRGS
jgi:lipid A ethanolaminephosphotransferase